MTSPSTAVNSVYTVLIVVVVLLAFFAARDIIAAYRRKARIERIRREYEEIQAAFTAALAAQKPMTQEEIERLKERYPAAPKTGQEVCETLEESKRYDEVSREIARERLARLNSTCEPRLKRRRTR